MDADILAVLCLARVDDDGDMDVKLDAYFSEFGHERVLQLKFFEPFRLL